MQPITSEQLAEIIERLATSSENDRELLLTELLYLAYPTHLTQDN